MDLKKIGFFLKELRKEKGVTQEQIAEILEYQGGLFRVGRPEPICLT